MGDWREKLKEIKRKLGADRDGPEPAKQPAGAVTVPAGPAPRPKLAKRYVCLGLDFGTSSTKAVLRLLQTGPAYAVPFEGLGNPGQIYLAPTRLAVSPQGVLRLGDATGGGWVEDLKVKLMERPWSPAPVYSGAALSARPADLAAGYLGLLLQKAFAWSEATVRPLIGSAEVVWSLNLGIPARDFGATAIKDAFLTAALAGWQLASEKTSIDLAAAAKTVDAARASDFKPRGIAREMVLVVPEVAAGVTTYGRSPQRQMGAHLFVDVGATTLDTSMFLLNQSTDGLRYAFLSADVDSELGAFRLHRHRASELGRLALARFAASNPLEPIPTTAQACVPPATEIDAIDETFLERCVRTIGKVVYQAKMKDAAVSIPDGGRVEPIHVLFSGGGIRLPLYQEAVRESGRRAAPNGGLGLRVRPFREAPIPRPQDLKAPGLSDDEWQRLGIAYGLSFAAEDIGEFVPPSAITPLPPPMRRERAEMTTKDQM